MNRRAWFSLNLLAALWGAVYIFTDVALRAFSPIQVVFVRVLLASLVLTPLAIKTRAFRGLARKAHYVIFTVLVQVTLPILLLTVGQQYIDTSLAGILVGAQPIFLAVLAALFARDQRPSGWSGILGIAIGFAGLALLFGFNFDTKAESPLGGVLVLASALGYAAGAVMVHRWLNDANPIGIAASSMIVSTVVLVVPAFLNPLKKGADLGPIIPGVIFLGVFCTGGALAIYYVLISRIGPAKAALAFYLSPVYAVILGLLFRRESVSVSAVIGLAAIIGGSVLAAGRSEDVMPGTSRIASSIVRVRRVFDAVWNDVGKTLRRACVVLWVFALLFLAAGLWVDSTGWWSSRPFLSNLASSLTGGLFGIPFALIVLQRISAREAARAEQISGMRVAVRATAHMTDATAALTPDLISSEWLEQAQDIAKNALSSIRLDPWKRRDYFDASAGPLDLLADWLTANKDELIRTTALVSVTWDLWKEAASSRLYLLDIDAMDFSLVGRINEQVVRLTRLANADISIPSIEVLANSRLNENNSFESTGIFMANELAHKINVDVSQKNQDAAVAQQLRDVLELFQATAELSSLVGRVKENVLASQPDGGSRR